MPPSHKRGVFRTFVHRKKTSPREVESLYHKKSPLVNSCGRFFRIFRRPAEERRGGRENLRRDTPPAHTASGGAARRTVEFAAGYAAHVPGGTASGKTDAAGSRGRIPTSGEGTDSQIPPSVCASHSGACRLTSLMSRRRGAQPCLSAASDTQSRPLSVRMQYLYARCAASHLLPLPRAASIAPLRRAGVSVCPPVCLEDGPRASPRAVQPEYLSGMGRRTSPHGSSSRTLIQSSHAESSRFV